MTEAAQTKQAQRRGWAWVAVAFAVLLAAFATAFEGFWGSRLNESVPAPAALIARAGASNQLVNPVIEADYQLAVWAVGRNAYTLLHRPTDLFQAEPCHPAPDALTLHHPVITPALTAAPVFAIANDPVVAFNAAVFLKIAIGFAAMFLLISDWTRSPPAGIAAGLLYAFHVIQIEHPYHLFTSDNAWLLFGLFFAQRMFAHGRFRDAVGLAAACCLQMASSFYPFFAACVSAAPILAWLLWHHRRERLPYSRILFVLAVVGVFGALLFVPYAEHAGETLTSRNKVFYAAWSTFLPGGGNFPGWTATALVALAFGLPRRRSLLGIAGDPRLALAGAALLVALFATGGNHNAQLLALAGGPAPVFLLPNPFAVLAGLLPGLGSVRLPVEFALVAREIACILAGIGAAGLLGLAPGRWWYGAAAALIVAVFVGTLGVPSAGGAAAPPFGALRIRPNDETLEFFEALEAGGNHGPLLELPLHRDNPAYTFLEAPRQQLLTAYHHRRTSACYVSFIPDSVRSLADLGEALPDDAALKQAYELGFTTIVIHTRDLLQDGASVAARFEAAAARPDSRLVRLESSPDRTAYAIGDPIR